MQDNLAELNLTYGGAHSTTLNPFGICSLVDNHQYDRAVRAVCALTFSRGPLCNKHHFRIALLTHDIDTDIVRIALQRKVEPGVS
jgi:hypothetical protein